MKIFTDEEVLKLREALEELRYANDTAPSERKYWEALAILDGARKVEVATWAGDLQGTDASFLTSARAAHEEPT